MKKVLPVLLVAALAAAGWFYFFRQESITLRSLGGLIGIALDPIDALRYE